MTPPQEEINPYKLSEREFWEYANKELAENLLEKFDNYIDVIINRMDELQDIP